MVMRASVALLAAAAAATVTSAAPPLRAADDADLIPQGVLDQPRAPATAAAPPTPTLTSTARLQAKLFLEDALTLSAFDNVIVPYPPSLASRWQDRASFDALVQWRPLGPLTFTLSDRLNLYVQDRQALASRSTLRNDLREAYVAWQPRTFVDLEAGRINVRDGVALGFNPTDFFKTRTLVGQASLDPSVVRQNRLGTLMVRSQAIWSGGSASFAFAPKVTSPSSIAGNDPVGVDPHLAATNAAPRLLATLSLDVLDLAPRFVAYYEPGRPKLGINLSRPIGSAVVVYAEWAGGPEEDLIARAIAFGKRTGTLPFDAPVVPATSTSTLFRNDVVAGLSWAVATKVTLNFEYDLHQAAFGRDNWRNWYDLGGAPGAPPALTNELWYLRAYANDQQEPLTRHQGFVRASWPRAFVSDLELSAFAFVDLLDGSVLGQAAASYYLSSRWTASVYLSGDLGATRSEHGSFPERVSSILQLTLYL
jgi:hypothetical protein